MNLPKSRPDRLFELDLHRPPSTQGARLGEVELGWVTPLSGDTNRQHAQIAANRVSGGGFQSALLSFGAIVALASDRYSSLWHRSAGNRAVGEDLAMLRDELGYLESRLGDLGAYRDFRLVLGHLA